MDGDQTCYLAADAVVRALHPGNRIVETYVYPTADVFTDQLITRTRTEKKIAVPVTENGVPRTRLYWRLFLPRAAPEQTGCSTVAAEYDLVLVASDQNNSLGTPAGGGRQLRHAGVRADARVHRVRPAGAGRLRPPVRRLPVVRRRCQTREYLLGAPYADHLTAYRDQHADLRRLLPGKRVLASPTGRRAATPGRPAMPRTRTRPRRPMLYQAAAARNTMLHSGRDVELWANVEAFEPGGTTVCANFLHRTDAQRIDQALTHLDNHVSKVISFQWDPLNGYHFNAATVNLTWYDAAWQPHSRTITVAESGWFDPMQAIWVPFPWTDLAPQFFVHADVTGAGKPANHRYSLAY